MIRCCKPDCPKRKSGCHAICPDYARERAKHEEDRQAKVKDAMSNSAIDSVQYHGLARCVKKKER